jgi:hypothetical protein
MSNIFLAFGKSPSEDFLFRFADLLALPGVLRLPVAGVLLVELVEGSAKYTKHAIGNKETVQVKFSTPWENA